MRGIGYNDRGGVDLEPGSKTLDGGGPGLMGGTSSAVLAGRLIHLPGANVVQTFAILIALYIPVGLVIGWIIAGIAGEMSWKMPSKSLWQLLFSSLPSWALGST